MEKKIIASDTTVYQALTENPELKDVLAEISPKFKKILNPIMFNSIAKVTTFKSAAKVGKIYIQELLLQLNEAIGLKDEYLSYTAVQIPKMQEEFLKKQFADTIDKKNGKPDWIDKISGFEVIDVRNDEEPFNLVTKKVLRLEQGLGLCVIQGFKPQPLIDFLVNKGYADYTDKKSEDEYRIYFYKKEGK